MERQRTCKGFSLSIIVLALLFGGVPRWGYHSLGYGPSGLGAVTCVWVAGGPEGQVVALTNHITTVAGREDDRTLTLILTQR